MIVSVTNRPEEGRIVNFQPTTGGSDETIPDHQLVRPSLEATKRHRTEDLAPKGFPAGCDSSNFCTVDAGGVILGPRSIDITQKPNEYVPKDGLLTVALILHDIAFAMFRYGFGGRS
jgi:hypothetical protein